MAVQVKVDRQGRVVLPLHERQRLGIANGGTLELTSTPEGLILERRLPAVVRIASDGLPIVSIKGLKTVTNEEALQGIHEDRERA
jgi:AbrB family looped-hinge helix DNA binding protein